VVFITDQVLAAAALSFEWAFSENGRTPNLQTTQFGEVSYLPQDTGSLDVTVRIMDASNNERASLSLTQDVVIPNPKLESLIAKASNEPGPGVANPDVARENVNNNTPYYQSVTLQTPETGDGFLRFVFGMVFEGALQRTPAQRKQQIERLAQSLNNGATDFAPLAAQGVGVSALRLALLAMTFQQSGANPALNWTELPETLSQRVLADEELREAVAGLDEAARIDLFNLARFPKSNIFRCAHILEALRDRYFSGTTFEDVLTGVSGTRAVRISQHYRVGPLRTD
jgi:hypothetical protein